MRTEELVALLQARPEGILSHELRRLMGVRRDGTPKALIRLRRLGILGMVEGSSTYTRWYAIEHKATALSADESYRRAVKEASRLAEKERERARSAGRKRKPKKKRVLAPTREVDDMPIVQRWITAGEAPLLRKQGPASVWDLAA